MVDQEGKLEKAGEAVKLLKSARLAKFLDILLLYTIPEKLLSKKFFLFLHIMIIYP